MSLCRDHQTLRGTVIMEQNSRDQKPKGSISDYLWLFSISIGLAIGAGIGAATDNIGAGIAIGLTVGVAVGFALYRQFKSDSNDN